MYKNVKIEEKNSDYETVQVQKLYDTNVLSKMYNIKNWKKNWCWNWASAKILFQKCAEQNAQYQKQ